MTDGTGGLRSWHIFKPWHDVIKCTVSNVRNDCDDRIDGDDEGYAIFLERAAVNSIVV